MLHHAVGMSARCAPVRTAEMAVMFRYEPVMILTRSGLSPPPPIMKKLHYPRADSTRPYASPLGRTIGAFRRMGPAGISLTICRMILQPSLISSMRTYAREQESASFIVGMLKSRLG